MRPETVAPYWRFAVVHLRGTQASATGPSAVRRRARAGGRTDGSLVDIDDTDSPRSHAVR